MAAAMQQTYGGRPVIYPTMAGTGPMHPVCEALGTPVTSGCGTGYQGHSLGRLLGCDALYGGVYPRVRRGLAARHG
jgi:hypothetical protein